MNSTLPQVISALGLYLLSCLSFSSHGYAEEITILDSAGFSRAAGEIETSETEVQFNLQTEQGTPANGVEVQLTNATTGEALTAVSRSGTVVFPKVSGGVWTVSTSVPGVTFTGTEIVGISTLALGVTPIAGQQRQ